MREIPRIAAASSTLYVRRTFAGSPLPVEFVRYSLSRRMGGSWRRADVVGACGVITPVSGQRQHDQAQCRRSRGARRAGTVTTEVACGESSQRVLEPSGRRCRGAMTLPSATSTGCGGSAAMRVRLESVANATSRTTMPPVVSSLASVRESPHAPEPAGLLPTAQRRSASRHARRTRFILSTTTSRSASAVS